MDLSGAAAILALLGIPVSVLIARWQTRTALRQTEEANRTALGIAEANYRNAVEVAEANHRSALEVMREQADAERKQWLRDTRRAEYRLFQNAVARFRRSYLAQEIDNEELRDAVIGLHESTYAIKEVGPDEVYVVVRTIKDRCSIAQMRLRSNSPDARAEWWRRNIRPYRTDLSEVMNRALGNS